MSLTHSLSLLESLIKDEGKLENLSQHIKELALPNATNHIVNQVEKTVEPVNLKEIHHIYFIGIGGIGMRHLQSIFTKMVKR